MVDVNEFNQFYLRGRVLYSEGKYADCISPYEEALKIASSNLAFANKLPEIFVALGSAYNYNGDYDRAKTSFENALAIAKDKGTKAGECSCYMNLSMVFRNLNNYPES